MCVFLEISVFLSLPAGTIVSFRRLVSGQFSREGF